MNIVVPVKTFSKNNILVNELLENFPNSKVNTKGQVFNDKELIEFIYGYDVMICGLEKIGEELLKAYRTKSTESLSDIMNLVIFGFVTVISIFFFIFYSFYCNLIISRKHSKICITTKNKFNFVF